MLGTSKFSTIGRALTFLWILARYRCKAALVTMLEGTHSSTLRGRYRNIEGITVWQMGLSSNGGMLMAVLGVLEWLIPMSKGAERKGLPADPLERFVEAVTAMGPTSIKMAQVLSARPDLVGERVAQALARCQDSLPSFPFAEVENTIAREFGKPWTELFHSIDVVPIAAASVAQVHKAVTSDHRTVALKVLRPGIHERFIRDLRFFAAIARMLHQNPDWQMLRLPDLVEEYRSMVALELDLTIEAAAAVRMAESLADRTDIKVPVIDWDRTSEGVLCLTWVDGVKINNLETLQTWGIDRARLVETCASLFFRQVFRDGFFHADLHPGNVLVTQDGTVWLIDFGIMGRLTIAQRDFLAEVIIGFLDRDYLRMAKAHARVGILPPDRSMELFAMKLRSVGEPLYGKKLGDFSISQVFRQTINAALSFQIRVQSEFFAMHRALVLVEGIARTLDPTLNVWTRMKPMIEPWTSQQSPWRRSLRDGKRSFDKAATIIQRIDTLTQFAVHQATILSGSQASDSLQSQRHGMKGTPQQGSTIFTKARSIQRSSTRSFVWGFVFGAILIGFFAWVGIGWRL